MKQILQNFGNGETILADVPCPRRASGYVLSETTRSLVSLGTEKMLIDFGKGSWLAKARSQPDKVKQVLQKIKTDGLFATVDAVNAKLDVPIPLGYCNVGLVLEADAAYDCQAGERIICNGPHAEVVAVPENLMARVPENVSDEQAAFTIVGAIALQGVRLLLPTLGERVVVSGLGLIGLLAVQILRAHGCQVMGIDFDARKLELARRFGAETVDLSTGADPVAATQHWTGGVGVDGVLITASAKGDELIHQVANMCRQRGRIVLVGVVGLDLQRADFYKKELSFQVSCSYGPGRNDPNFEQRGLDYPIGFVRWTEQRNFQAVLELMADGKIDVEPLVTHRFKFDDALEGYRAVSDRRALGIVLDYGLPEGLGSRKSERVVAVGAGRRDRRAGNAEQGPMSREDGRRDSLEALENLEVAFVGAGGFTTGALMPLLPKQGIVRKTVVSSTGVSAAYAAKKFGFESISSDFQSMLDDDGVNSVFITTPHDVHAKMVCAALAAGKHVFVEKPLALNTDDLVKVEKALEANRSQCLMVGFNRRFSPHMTAVKEWLRASTTAKAVVITVNAGAIPAEHWTQDLEIGGGRIVGEACHFVDLARFLVDAPIEATHGFAVGGGDGRLGDCAAIQLQFGDGSLATIHYLANGSKDFAKERIEVFTGGRVIVCDNFRKTREIGGQGRKLNTRRQDKGYRQELACFVQSLLGGGAWPIPREELLDVSRATIEAAEQVRAQLAGLG